MKHLHYKLIVTDLDGTLVKTGTDEISPNTINIIKNLREQGIFFTIATGRSWKKTKAIAQKLEITLPIIVQSGAIIIDPLTEEPIRIKPLRIELGKKLQQIYDTTQVDLFCLNETGIYFTTGINTKGGNSLATYYEESCKIGKAVEFPCTVIKQLLIGPEPVIKQLAGKINKQIRPRPNTILWPPEPGIDDYFLEVFDPLASKGQAVKWLADYFKIKRGQVIAFGDGHNDLDLLQWAGLGIVIEGAPVILASHANVIIPRPDCDGVAQFLNDKFYNKLNNSWLNSIKKHEV